MTKWIASKCLEHAFRIDMCMACTDPSTAAAADVPYVNLRHAWLPWLRVWLHLRRYRFLERAWAESALVHLILVSVGFASTAAIVAWWSYTSPSTDLDSATAMCVLVAFACACPAAVLAALAAKTTALQEDEVRRSTEVSLGAHFIFMYFLSYAFWSHFLVPPPSLTADIARAWRSAGGDGEGRKMAAESGQIERLAVSRRAR